MTTLLSRTRRAMNSAEGGEEDLYFCKVVGDVCLFQDVSCITYLVFVLSVYFCFVVCLFVCLLILICFSKLVSCNYRNFLLKVYFFWDTPIELQIRQLQQKRAASFIGQQLRQQWEDQRPIKRRLRAGSSQLCKKCSTTDVRETAKTHLLCLPNLEPKVGKESSQKVLIFCENDVR